MCVYAIKGKAEGFYKKLKKLDPSDVCISSVTYAELMNGVKKSREEKRNRVAMMVWLANIEVLDFDANAAEEYGNVRANLEKKGESMDVLDMMVAGHAKSLGYTVITDNIKDFKRVKGLKVGSWV